jgi:glucosamine-6-phosphate deaminase
MDLRVFPSSAAATGAATDWLVDRLRQRTTRNLMVAGGNTPLGLYAEVARRGVCLEQLHVFALDEYVGVPEDEPRNCANLIRRTVVEAWEIPPSQYYCLSSLHDKALESIARHEERIRSAGGLDLVVLGLGQNGHVGFNEPGSDATSPGRIVPLSPVSIEANRSWFGGDYTPNFGVTTGMQTILSAKQVLLLAFGPAKAEAARAMIEGPPAASCPASFLQRHSDVTVFLDVPAASRLNRANRGENGSSRDRGRG